MKLSEFIADMQSLASSMKPEGVDPEVVLYDREGDRELAVDPGADVFGFEVLRGEGQIVIEF